MRTLPYLLATAGHVDHGKSTLVKTLTGIDPDRLPEEKSRGITIDLGFAPLWLEHPHDDAARLQVGIIDVPGHEDYITTMAAGTGAADAALLVVAANEGWMPQTQEHFEILQYQQIPRLVVAITKADAGVLEETRQGVRQRLNGSRFADSPIVAVSALTGAGLSELKTTLATMLLIAPPRNDAGKPRLFIDRVFSRPGLGTIVTGSLIGGALAAQMPIRIDPQQHQSRIRTLHTHGAATERAMPGMRVAANLPDVPAHGPGAPKRGDVVMSPRCAGAVDSFDAALWRLESNVPSLARALVRNGMQVRIQLGTQDVGAKLLVLQGDPIAAGGSGLVQLRCERPVSLFAGDFIVVRDWSKRHTLAGGRALVLDASRSRMRTDSRIDRLARLAASMDDIKKLVTETVPAVGAVRRSQLLLQSRWSDGEIAAAIDDAIAAGTLGCTEEWIYRRQWLERIAAESVALITRWHTQHPTEAGMPMLEWKSALARMGVPPELLPQVLSAGRRMLHVHDNRIRLQSHRPQLPAYLTGAERRLREELGRHPFDPPSRAQLAPDLRSREALDYLVAVGDVVAIAPTVLISREAFQSAIVRIRQFLRANAGRGATVAELKQLLGSNRRVMVPLLEMLDARGITKRKGDLRTLCEAPAEQQAAV
ncbi:MAG: selenocysteine-specific translation elongation factor [Phycisphaerae bacterium]